MGSRVPCIEGVSERYLNAALQYKKTHQIIDIELNISLIANSLVKDTAVHSFTYHFFL
jgi:hypothetical protein